MNHKPTRHPAPRVTSWGVKVKLGAGAREGLTDPGHRSPAVTHTARNPRGPFVPVSLNFPFRDFFFFLNSPLFQSKLCRRTLSPQTRDQKLHTWLQPWSATPDRPRGLYCCHCGAWSICPHHSFGFSCLPQPPHCAIPWWEEQPQPRGFTNCFIYTCAAQ